MKYKFVFSAICACACIVTYGQGVKISNNGTQPDASAQLQVESTNKGVLIPQVDLQNATDAVTIASPASSLLVFNTGNTLSPSGYYYNGGTPQSPQWIRVFTSPAQDTLDMGTNPVVNVPLPVNPNDAVNKDYVDNVLLANGGGISFSPPTHVSNGSPAGIRFIAAVDYCKTLVEGGYSDWRLPTDAEFIYIMGADAIVVPALNPSTYYWLADKSTYSSSSNADIQFRYCYYTSSSLAASYITQYSTSSAVPRAFCVR